MQELEITIDALIRAYNVGLRLYRIGTVADISPGYRLSEVARDGFKFLFDYSIGIYLSAHDV